MRRPSGQESVTSLQTEGGRLQATNCRECAIRRREILIGLFMKPADTTNENVRKRNHMTACPRCDARFTGAPDIERQWIERHVSRHGATRLAPAGEEPARDIRKLNTAA